MADLERELEEQDMMRSKLQEVYDAGAGSLVKQSGEAAHIESLVESAAREERRRQEQVIGVSASWERTPVDPSGITGAPISGGGLDMSLSGSKLR